MIWGKLKKKSSRFCWWKNCSHNLNQLFTLLHDSLHAILLLFGDQLNDRFLQTVRILLCVFVKKECRSAIWSGYWKEWRDGSAVANFASCYFQLKRSKLHWTNTADFSTRVLFRNSPRDYFQASTLPLSIIIVGVGYDSFEEMKVLDSDNQMLSSNGKFAKRDIVQVLIHLYLTHWNKKRGKKNILISFSTQFVSLTIFRAVTTARGIFLPHCVSHLSWGEKGQHIAKWLSFPNSGTISNFYIVLSPGQFSSQNYIHALYRIYQNSRIKLWWEAMMTVGKQLENGKLIEM